MLGQHQQPLQELWQEVAALRQTVEALNARLNQQR